MLSNHSLHSIAHLWISGVLLSTLREFNYVKPYREEKRLPWGGGGDMRFSSSFCFSVFSKFSRRSVYHLFAHVFGHWECWGHEGFTWGHSVSQGREGVYLLLAVVLELSLVLDHVLCQLFSLGIPGQCGKCKFKTPTNMKPLLEISGETFPFPSRA